jgi:hypothetical protein
VEHVFGRKGRLGRKRRGVKGGTPGQLARAEFGEGLAHLRLAATHGADRMNEVVGPRLRTARAAVLVPLAAAAARAGVAEDGKPGRKAPRTKESKMSRKRTRLLAGLLAAGTAAGVAGALVARRRSRARWDEYESRGSAATATGTASVATAMDRDPQWAGTDRQTAPDWATSTKDSAGQPAGATETTAEMVADPMDLSAEQFSENASPVSKNSRG